MRRTRTAVIVSIAFAAAASAWVDPKEETFIGNRRNWWAFQKPVRHPVPAIKDPWVRTPIDAFLLQALNARSVKPSAPLDKARLLRRVTLDLTGLPPTAAEIDLFIADAAAGAYQKVVDRLLQSPQYGERWAQRWLDIVRYADTNGYELDAERPHAWRYRDYVVRSFNQDKPYSLFVKEQIAGDELYPRSSDALIATGFHRAGPIHLVGGNQDEEANRQEVVSEMSGAIGSVFLGMTIGCAKCHNHKFDPILQADYYRLQAIFASTEGKDVDLSTEQERVRHDQEVKAYQGRLKPVTDQIAEIEKPYRERIKKEKTAQLEPKLRVALDVPKEKRTDEQKKLAKDAEAQIGSSWDEILAVLSPVDRERRTALRKRLHEIELTEPEPLPTAYAVQNAAQAPQAHILKIGDVHQKLGPVDPGLPSVLSVNNGDVTKDACSRRSALANWLASPDHPLTARVMVNRIWQFRMGIGLVRTPNDFGRLGERPTNPKLLDWLATEFMEQNWSVKAIDRMIVLSSAYMQSGADDPHKSKIDADNALYWRTNRRRLEGEAIRDGVLAVAGKLNPRMGGVPVKVPIEQEIYDLIFSEAEPDNLWPLLPDENEHNRRSLYLLNKRTVRLPLLMNFDQPDAMTSCPVRPTSTHALQALSLMNSELMHKQSEAFAKRLETECGTDRSCQLRRAYKLTLARPPKASEIKMANEFLAGKGLMPDFCLALLNRNEFIYIP
jgi:hypothetical protein